MTVLRALAGVLDRTGSPEAMRERCTRALAGEPGISSGSWGPLALAWSGGGTICESPVVCALSGRLDEPASADPQAALGQAWAADREGALARLRGECSALLWDPAGARGVLVQAPQTGTGLFWAAAGGTLAFASDVAWLLRLLPSRPGPDELAAASWAALAAPPADRTLYEGVSRLLAGTALELAGRPALRRIWRPQTADPADETIEQAGARVGEAIAAAVRRRWERRSVAVQLSGGLDSGTVAVFAGRAGGDGGRAYGLRFPLHPSADESGLIEATATRAGLALHASDAAAGSALAGAAAYLERWSLPPLSPNHAAWQPLLQAASADGIRVLLDGEGGDELFGLPTGLIADRLASGRVLSAWRLARAAPWLGGGLRALAGSHGAGALVPGSARLARHARARLRPRPPWLRPQAAAVIASGWEPPPAAAPRWRSWLGRLLTEDPSAALVFEEVRRRAWPHGVAVSHPLRDPGVVEAVLRTAPELAWVPPLARPLQRAATAGMLPDEVRLRPGKSTFEAPMLAALTGPDRPALADLLAGSRLEIARWVDPAVLRSEILEPRRAAGSAAVLWAVSAWRLAVLEMWLRRETGRA